MSVSGHGMAVVAVQRCVLLAHPHVLFPVRASVPLPVTWEVGLGRLGYGPLALGSVLAPVVVLWCGGVGAGAGAFPALLYSAHDVHVHPHDAGVRCRAVLCLCSRHCGAVPFASLI